MGRILSVEFNKNSIKVVEACRKGAALSVLRCFDLDAATGIESGRINDIGLIANLVNKELIKNNIRTGKAVFVVNSDCIITRNMKLPFLEKEYEILSMIRLELSQLIPIDFSRYKIIYNIAEVVEDNDVKIAFYVIYCIPERLFQDLKELAKRLKMRFTCLHISFCCLNNIFARNININGRIPDEKNIYAFIDINSQYISFCTLNKDINDFSRLSFYGQDEYFVEALDESKYSYIEGADDFHTFKYEMLDKINRYVKYYYSVNNSNCINKLYIYGDNSKDNNISGFLAQNLKIEVEVINQIQGICFDDMSLNDNIIPNKYFIPILSLFKGKKDICFSVDGPAEFVCRPKLLASACAAIILFASCLALKYYDIVISDKIYNMSLFVEDEDNVRRNGAIESLKGEVALLENYLEQAVKLKALISRVDFVSPVIFREIFNAIPQHTRVSSISADINGTQLYCISESMDDVTLFLHNLRKIEFIEDINLADIDAEQEGSGKYSYSVICNLKDVSDIVQ